MDIKAKPRKLLGLTCGTLTAWFCVLVFHLFSAGISNDIISTIKFFFTVLIWWYVIIGLPIAFIVCLTFGGLTWYIFEALRRTKLRHAIVGGAVVGAIFGIWLILMSRDTTEVTIIITYMLPPILIGMASGFVTHYFGYKDSDV